MWFTSDTHFWHRNIIQYCDRPFSNIWEMNDEIVKRWNSRIGARDIVYHLGDFAMCNRKYVDEILSSLNGRIHLIRGNHDYKVVKGELAKRFESVAFYGELDHNKTKIVMSHYPFLTWNKRHWGSWSLHGHSHGGLPESNEKRLDVGVDTNNYYPYHVSEIAEIMITRSIDFGNRKNVDM